MENYSGKVVKPNQKSFQQIQEFPRIEKGEKIEVIKPSITFCQIISIIHSCLPLVEAIVGKSKINDMSLLGQFWA